MVAGAFVTATAYGAQKMQDSLVIRVIVIMGVAGSGKTTVGKALAQRLGWQFVDADDFHSAANVQKMQSGEPLTDEDRAPWLELLGSKIQSWCESNAPAVLACSALREEYRHHLHADDPQVRIVYLKGDFTLLNGRLQKRKGHFMKAAMLESQFSTLEEPRNAIIVDASKPPTEIVDDVVSELNL